MSVSADVCIRLHGFQMGVPSLISLLIVEAKIAVDSAVAAAEGLASHGVVESVTFDRMIGFLADAQQAVGKLEEANIQALRVEGCRFRDVAQAEIAAVAPRRLRNPIRKAANDDPEAA